MDVCKLMVTFKIKKTAYLVNLLRHDKHELLKLIMEGKIVGRRDRTSTIH